MPKISELSDIGAIAFNDDFPVLDASESITKRISVNDLYLQFVANLDVRQDIFNSVQFVDQDLAQATDVDLTYPTVQIITFWNITNPNQSANTNVRLPYDDDPRFFIVFNNDATYSIDFLGANYNKMYYNGTVSASITIPPLKTLFGLAMAWVSDDNIYVLNTV